MGAVPDQDRDNWRLQVYKEGSEACRNYSQLTLQARNVAQYVSAIGLVGVGAVVGKDYQFGTESPLLQVSGMSLIIIAISLGLVDWHYQSAFTAIRDGLAIEEVKHKICGPWRCHLEVRTGIKDHLASYLPFLIVGWLGLGAIALGQPNRIFGRVVPAVAVLMSIVGFFLILVTVAKKHQKMRDDANKIWAPRI